MASKKRNALAELAEELSKDSKIIFGCGGGGPMATVISARQEKASQIISELAKVQDEESALLSMKFLNSDEARRIACQRKENCILKCRAIAEEGVSNGK